MPALDRRQFLALSGAAAVLPVLCGEAAGAAPAPSFDEASAILFDATRCIGCRACMRACRTANQLPPDPADVGGKAFDLPRRLSERNWLVVGVQRGKRTGPEPAPWTYVQRSCMHCNTPACVTACPVAALKKTPEGPVVYDESRCIGCRYCQLACAYGVPQYEWVARVPRVRKCKLCMACVEVCPSGALMQGTRKNLLLEAEKRLQEQPKRYVKHIYGKDEAGGASRLCLSAVPFYETGYPDLPASTRSRYSDAVMGSLPGWIIGAALFLGGVYRTVKRRGGAEKDPGDGEGTAP